jgi:hypothetical protein
MEAQEAITVDDLESPRKPRASPKKTVQSSVPLPLVPKFLQGLSVLTTSCAQGM